jgi:ribosomal protein S18 acetylase RimI-like enzyme
MIRNMVICGRPFEGERDLSAMTALAYAFPDDQPHLIDLPYRLSSWALDDSRNLRLWTGDAGNLVAWAALQPPFWAIDFVCRPDLERAVYREFLVWGMERARETIEAGSDVTQWYVTVFPEQEGRRRDLEEAGFANQADLGEDSWSKTLFQRPAKGAIRRVCLPQGFSIRSLRGEGEVETYAAAHRAAFGTRNMTAAWRMRTLRWPEYLPDLDLVAVAPDGSLAGFCIGWLHRSGEAVTGQIEPLGVIEDYRRLGLGRALLVEELRRMYDLGAQTVLVETDNYRHAALGLYPAMGFIVQREMLIYGRTLS